MLDRRTIVFFPEGAYGPTNNCVGIGQVLQAHGHRVVFIVEESFAGRLEAQGFEERLMRLGPPPETEEVPGQFWIDFIRDTAPIFRKPTIEQLGDFMQPTWQALIDGSRYVDERLREIIDEVDPDVLVEDNVVAFPALPASGRPWVRIVSCNPAELKDPAVPPLSSGYPVDDRSAWPAFRAEIERTHRPMWEDFDTFVRERGGAGPDLGGRGPGVHPRIAVAQPVLVPERGGLRSRPSAGTDLASPRLHRSSDRRDVGATVPHARPGGIAHLSLPR